MKKKNEFSCSCSGINILSIEINRRNKEDITDRQENKSMQETKKYQWQVHPKVINLQNVKDRYSKYI